MFKVIWRVTRWLDFVKVELYNFCFQGSIWVGIEDCVKLEDQLIVNERTADCDWESSWLWLREQLIVFTLFTRVRETGTLHGTRYELQSFYGLSWCYMIIFRYINVDSRCMCVNIGLFGVYLFIKQKWWWYTFYIYFFSHKVNRFQIVCWEMNVMYLCEAIGLVQV